MEPTKKEPTPEMIGMLIMGGVNFPRIEVSKFDGNILTSGRFGSSFKLPFMKSHTQEMLIS